MLIASYSVEIKAPLSGEKWYDPYYDVAEENNWALYTLSTYENYANEAISRGEVARLIASADGKVFTYIDDAIEYLYDNDYSTGKTDKTIEGYKSSDTLTRAEAIKFVDNFASKRKNNLISKAIVVDNTASSGLVSISESYDVIKKVLDIHGYEITSEVINAGTDVSINIKKDTKSGLVSVRSYKSKGNKIYSINIWTDPDLELVNDLVTTLSKDKFSVGKDVLDTDFYEVKPVGQYKYNAFSNNGRITVNILYTLE